MKHILSLLTCAAPFWALASLSAGPAVAAASRLRQGQATTSPVARLSSTAPMAKALPFERPATKKKQVRPLGSSLALTTLKQPAAGPSGAVPTATQTVLLRGVVLLPTGLPQPGASVYMAGAPHQLVVTDAQGAFALPVPAGTAVSLRIEYFGEGTSRVEIPTPTAKVLRITLGQ